MIGLRAVLACLLAAIPTTAQILVDPNTPEGKSAIDSFDKYLDASSVGKLACTVNRYPPTLDYGLRLWAGFNAVLPAAQFPMKPGDPAVVMFRVRPTSAPTPPSYFWTRFNVPAKPPQVTDVRKLEFSVGGGFLLGPGKYSVDWFMLDSTGRRCRQSWTLKAEARNATVVTPPNTVEAADRQFWTGFPQDSTKPSHVTVFLHAAPIRPRNYVAKLSPWDRQVLLSSLVSLLREGGFTSASVVVFDLERRQVLYREPQFSRRGLRDLARQLATVNLSTISMEVMTSGPSPGEFLEGLLRNELKEPKPSDTFVFLGTTWRAGPKLPPAPPDLREAVPPTWFLALSTPYFAPHRDPIRQPLPPRDLPLDLRPSGLGDLDSVTSLVRSLKGKVITIYRPVDLAGGIRLLTAGRNSTAGQ
jgi:hypothetical protein